MTYQDYKQALAKIDAQKSETYASTKEKISRASGAYLSDLITAREYIQLIEEAEQEENRKIDELNQAIDDLPEYNKTE